MIYLLLILFICIGSPIYVWMKLSAMETDLELYGIRLDIQERRLKNLVDEFLKIRKDLDNGVKKMTIGDLIKDKDYDYISYRMIIPGVNNGNSIFAGCFKSENGKIISLDGDTYSEDEEVVEWSEFTNPSRGVENGLEVVVEAEVWR